MFRHSLVHRHSIPLSISVSGIPIHPKPHPSPGSPFGHINHTIPVPADYGSYGWHSRQSLSGFSDDAPILQEELPHPVHLHRDADILLLPSSSFRSGQIPCWHQTSTYGDLHSSNCHLSVCRHKAALSSTCTDKVHPDSSGEVSSPSMILFLSQYLQPYPPLSYGPVLPVYLLHHKVPQKPPMHQQPSHVSLLPYRLPLPPAYRSAK